MDHSKEPATSAAAAAATAAAAAVAAAAALSNKPNKDLHYAEDRVP